VDDQTNNPVLTLADARTLLQAANVILLDRLNRVEADFARVQQCRRLVDEANKRSTE
jgi:transposase